MTVAGFVVRFAGVLAIAACAGCGITFNDEDTARSTDEEETVANNAAVKVDVGGAKIVPAAARSVVVQFHNNSDRALTRVAFSLDHGCSVTDPPGTIAANTTVVWVSESCGVATGTEGRTSYQVDGESQNAIASFHWDNPFIGSNSFDESAPVGFTASHDGGGGNNATVTFNFGCSSTTCDGIPDDWKRNGVFIDSATNQECPAQNRPATCQFIDLPTMGADVSRPEIFLQIDWMADAVDNHQLSQAAIQAVVNAFATSPYHAVNGAVGITVHVDEGANSVNFPVALSKARQLAEVKNLGTAVVVGTSINYNFTAFNNIKNAAGGFTSTGRGPIFHYVVSAHNIATLTNSGIAPEPGSDLIVSLGSFSPVTQLQQQGTLMHELGHNLRLNHGGTDGTNNKPNYFSVMNYSFQMKGLIVSGVQGTLDYSGNAQPELNKTALNENTGLGARAGAFGTQHWCPPVPATPGLPAVPGAFVTVLTANGPIDWDCDGALNPKPVPADVNNDPTSTKLAGANDWERIILHVGSIGGTGEAAPIEIPMDETLTPDVEALVLPVDSQAPVTVASASPPANAHGWNRSTVTVSLTASDDISGVAAIRYDLDGAGPTPFAGPFDIASEGVHSFEFFSVDRSQNQEPAHKATVQIDETAPVLSCPSAVTLECAGRTTQGTFQVTAFDALSGVDSLGCKFPSGSAFLFGTTLDTCTATDLADNVGTCQFDVTVQDTTPPVIRDLAPTPSVLWPPNHRMVSVTVAARASDICDSAPTCAITGVTSNEPINGPGDGNTDPDWVVTGTLSLDLRAERAGNGSGRVYQIAITCTDFAGNRTSGTTAVTVPHSAP